MTGLCTRHVRYSVASCMVAALSVGAADWIDTPYQDSRQRVPHRWRQPLYDWLCRHPALKALYEAKEVLHGFYRTKSRKQAKLRLTGLCDALALTQIPELSTLRSTLVRWRKEILAYWLCRLTNARTEGFNNKAKLVKRRAFGYVSFRHYRLRLLNACSG